ELMTVERYSHVMHLVSNITGRLRPDCSPMDALRACFPAGTVTGAPKIRAMEIIAELERERRGVYAGAIGYLSFTGDLDTCIAIRTMVVKDGLATVQAAAGICKDVLRGLGAALPTLGVCLGHQCLGEAFGGTVRRASRVMHGKVSSVVHHQQSVFRGIPSPFAATRYHSLVVDRDSLPADLEVTASTEDATVMGLRHRKYPLAGVQFHPEAILTEHGHKLLENFLLDARTWRNTNTPREV